MTHKLTGPCADCPFRKDRHFPLTACRAAEIAGNLLEGGDFPCHKTLDYNVDGPPAINGEGAQRCGGMLIVMEKSGIRNRIMQIAQRLGLYRPEKLDMEAPVHESLEAWLDSYRSP